MRVHLKGIHTAKVKVASGQRINYYYAWRNGRTAWGETMRKAKITGLHFHDLRGTAVTRLAEAECSNAEICSITGHAMKDVGAILDKYLARTDKIALAAIAKLERGMK